MPDGRRRADTLVIAIVSLSRVLDDSPLGRHGHRIRALNAETAEQKVALTAAC